MDYLRAPVIKEFSEFFMISEKKDHIINKLDSLSPEEKELLINFFNKNPHLESKINWNNKNLTFNDFKDVLDSISKTRLKKEVSAKGISGMREGKDYVDCSFMFGKYGPKAYAPLTHQASQLIASKRVGSVEGKWCVAENDPQYWIQYTNVGVIFIYLLEDDGDKKAIAVYKDGRTEMYDSEDEDLSSTYISRDYRDMIQNHLSFIDSHIRSKIPVSPPEWFSSAKTRNAKWHYSETNPGFFIMDSGEWLSGTWKDGQMKADVEFRGGEFRGGYFYGHFYDGTFSAGYFRGTWHGGKWKGSSLAVWDDGKHPSGVVMVVSPDKWESLNSIIIDLGKYFTMDEETVKLLPREYLDEGKELLEACRSYKIVDRRGRGIMRLQLKTGGLYVYNTIVDGFNGYNGYGITFLGSAIHDCDSQVYFNTCDFEAGKYSMVYESTMSGCTITGGTFILEMNSRNQWVNFDNTIKGGTFICPNKNNPGTLMSDKGELFNATFHNLFIESEKIKKCTLEDCYINHDIVKLLYNCKLINTKEYNKPS